MSRRSFIGSVALLASVLGTASVLAAWKEAALEHADAAAASQPEPAESVTVALAHERQHRRTTTSIGTVRALRSITLRNELPGTVSQVALTPGQIVEAGTVLLTLDVSVEEAELQAQEAQAALAATVLHRMQSANERHAVSEVDVERARAEHDVAVAQIARTKAIIARKTLRAPFRARVGLADVHLGQYLREGTDLTTLQGVDDAAHVDFTVAQPVAAGLREGQQVEILAGADAAVIPAEIVAIDARIDAVTRNATVRARIADAAEAPAPGASVRVHVPVGPAEDVVAVPVSALRRGPSGDHVFVIAADPQGNPRAEDRQVSAGATVGNEVVIHAGLSAGEQVATSGSFKLRDGVLVTIPADPSESPAEGHAEGHAEDHDEGHKP